MYDTNDEPFPEEFIEQVVDSGPSSGSLSDTEDWMRANARPAQNDGRSPTRTTFYANDTDSHGPGQKHRDPSDRRSWASLATWQDGVGSDISRGSQNWWADKQRWTETFGDLIGASEFHVERTKFVLEELDMTPYKSAHTTAEVVILGILSLLVDSDVNDFENRALAREGTRELMDDLEIGVDEYEDVRRLIRKNDKELLFPDSVSE